MSLFDFNYDKNLPDRNKNEFAKKEFLIIFQDISIYQLLGQSFVWNILRAKSFFSDGVDLFSSCFLEITDMKALKLGCQWFGWINYTIIWIKWTKTSNGYRSTSTNSEFRSLYVHADSVQVCSLCTVPVIRSFNANHSSWMTHQTTRLALHGARKIPR